VAVTENMADSRKGGQPDGEGLCDLLNNTSEDSGEGNGYSDSNLVK
jgi:hypothetical protein